MNPLFEIALLFRCLKTRDLQPEVMDRPDLPADRHRQALAGLARVNVLSNSSAIVWKPVRRLAARRGLRELSVLDIASGGGDVAVGLCRRAERAGLKLRVTGYDISATAVETARNRAASAGVAAEFSVYDIFSGPPEALERRFDVVMCSLFLHHLDEPQAVELLRRMALLARHMVLVNDLLRTRMGYLAAQVVVRLVTRSDVVHYDGPQSVAAAFRFEEVRRLAASAGLSNTTIRKVWPFRFLLTWESAI